MCSSTRYLATRLPSFDVQIDVPEEALDVKAFDEVEDDLGWLVRWIRSGVVRSDVRAEENLRFCGEAAPKPHASVIGCARDLHGLADRRETWARAS